MQMRETSSLEQMNTLKKLFYVLADIYEKPNEFLQKLQQAFEIIDNFSDSMKSLYKSLEETMNFINFLKKVKDLQMPEDSLSLDNENRKEACKAVWSAYLHSVTSHEIVSGSTDIDYYTTL